jgi:SEC-C motif domain protein
LESSFEIAKKSLDWVLTYALLRLLWPMSALHTVLSMKVRNQICPCRIREVGNNPPDEFFYDACCGRFHRAASNAPGAATSYPPTPEELMRSRYSAYALAQKNDAIGQGMLRYLLATWHVGTSPGELEISPTQWIGLDLLVAETRDDAGIVEFVAWFRENGKATKMHERSRFVKQAGRWLYLDGKEDAGT